MFCRENFKDLQKVFLLLTVRCRHFTYYAQHTSPENIFQHKSKAKMCRKRQQKKMGKCNQLMRRRLRQGLSVSLTASFSLILYILRHFLWVLDSGFRVWVRGMGSDLEFECEMNPFFGLWRRSLSGISSYGHCESLLSCFWLFLLLFVLLLLLVAWWWRHLCQVREKTMVTLSIFRIVCALAPKSKVAKKQQQQQQEM